MRTTRIVLLTVVFTLSVLFVVTQTAFFTMNLMDGPLHIFYHHYSPFRVGLSCQEIWDMKPRTTSVHYTDLTAGNGEESCRGLENLNPMQIWLMYRLVDAGLMVVDGP